MTTFHRGDRVLYKTEHCTVVDIRLDGELIVIVDEYGAHFNVTPDLIERLGYRATVDGEGWVRDIEDEPEEFVHNIEGDPAFNGSLKDA